MVSYYLRRKSYTDLRLVKSYENVFGVPDSATEENVPNNVF